MFWQKNYTTCTMHAVSLSNLMDFSLSRKFSRNFRENFAKIVPFSHDFRIFAKIEKCIFVSTLFTRLDTVLFIGFELKRKNGYRYWIPVTNRMKLACLPACAGTSGNGTSNSRARSWTRHRYSMLETMVPFLSYEPPCEQSDQICF
jgi:hypothetical protein